MNTRLDPRIEWFCCGVIAAVGAYVALSGFLIRPGLWFDEGITIEIARNFALFGTLDILTAPHVFSGVAYLVGTNGFPLTLPLAAVFKLFGFGLVQARVFMFFWFAATIATLYGVTRKLFGVAAALSAGALAVTFASLYADGLTATGELPGICFFLIGTWFLIGRNNYFLTGICWGLAMAAKPGVFLLLVHTTVLYVLFFDRARWFRKLVVAGVGFALPVAVWIVLAFPLTSNTFYSAVAYVLNPIDIPVVTPFLAAHLPEHTLGQDLVVPPTHSASDFVAANLHAIFTSSTLVYFLVLMIITLVGLWRGNESERRLARLLLVYGALTLVFFIRGPGWTRYLIGLQVLIYVALFPTLKNIAVMLRPYLTRLAPPVSASRLALGVTAVLIVGQVGQLAFLSEIPSSPRVLEALRYLDALMLEHPAATIGTYDIPEITAFMDPERTYDQSLPQEGLAPLGESPLLQPTPPDVVVMSRQHTLLGPAEERVLADSYAQIDPESKYDIYERKTSDHL